MNTTPHVAAWRSLIVTLALTSLGLAQTSEPGTFTQVRYEVRVPVRGGAITRTVTVHATGEVEVVRRRGRDLETFTGRTTQAELRDLEAAVALAQLRTVRDPQQDPLFAHVPPRMVARDSFELEIQSPQRDLDGATRGKLSFYGRRDTRLHRLLTLLACVGKRVGVRPVVETTISGGIEVLGMRGFRSVHLVAGREDTRIEPWAVARTLIGLEGETCRVRGVLAGDELLASRILSPVRRDVRAWVTRVEGAAQVLVAGDGLEFPALPPEAERRLAGVTGPAAAVLATRAEALVSLDGWVFSDDAGRVTKVHVVSVRGYAKPGSRLATSNALPVWLTPGQSMDLLGVTPSGRSFRVRLADGREGAVLLEGVRLGPVRARGLADSAAFGD